MMSSEQCAVVCSWRMKLVLWDNTDAQKYCRIHTIQKLIQICHLVVWVTSRRANIQGVPAPLFSNKTVKIALNILKAIHCMQSFISDEYFLEFDNSETKHNPWQVIKGNILIQLVGPLNITTRIFLIVTEQFEVRIRCCCVLEVAEFLGVLILNSKAGAGGTAPTHSCIHTWCASTIIIIYTVVY